jgi:hypothetical protein
MKVFRLLLALIACAALTCLAQNTPTPQNAPAPPAQNAQATPNPVPEGLPEEYGVYHQTDRGWDRMHQNRANKTEMKRGGFTQWTGIGVGGYHQKLDYTGPNAQCQITQSRPKFYVRLADATHVQELTIVRFKEKKDKRQIETAEHFGNESKMKADVYTVTVKRLAPELFVVTPESDLAAGEYILSQSTYATEGYDFGIVAN